MTWYIGDCQAVRVNTASAQAQDARQECNGYISNHGDLNGG